MDVSMPGLWDRFKSEEPMDTVEAIDYIEQLIDYVDSGAVNPVDALHRMKLVIEYCEEYPSE
jgi:hypothetical protein